MTTTYREKKTQVIFVWLTSGTVGYILETMTRWLQCDPARYKLIKIHQAICIYHWPGTYPSYKSNEQQGGPPCMTYGYKPQSITVVHYPCCFASWTRTLADYPDYNHCCL